MIIIVYFKYCFQIAPNLYNNNNDSFMFYNELIVRYGNYSSVIYYILI